MLLVIQASYYYFLNCMDLNFHIPIEQYEAPWATLRHITAIITEVIHIGSAISYVFSNNNIVIVIMQVLVFLSLLAKNILKFKNAYYLNYKVNFVDTFLNSFMIIYVFLALLITQINLPYTFNSLYLLFFISLLFALALSYVHVFFRAAALEKFFTNF